MPRDAKVYSVLIASPSDVQVERHVLRDVVYDWNRIHSRKDGLVLLPVLWETDAHPASGDRPQQIINRQIVDESDIVIAVFWYRMGSATGAHPSGTAEEIDRFLKNRKQVLVYFSEANIPIDHDPDQLRTLKSYRDVLKNSALIWTFKDPEHLHKLATAHLASAINELVLQGSGAPVLQTGESKRIRRPEITVVGEYPPHQSLQLSSAKPMSVRSLDYMTNEGVRIAREEFTALRGHQIEVPIQHDHLVKIHNLKPRTGAEAIAVKFKLRFTWDGEEGEIQEVYLPAMMMPGFKSINSTATYYMNVIA